MQVEIYRKLSSEADTAYTLIATLSDSAVDYIASGLTANTSYDFKIYRKNANGETDEGVVVTGITGSSAVPLTAPTLSTGTVDGTSIQLNWTLVAAEDANRTGVHVEVSDDGVNFTQLIVTASTATTYTHTGLTAGVTKHYRVLADGDDLNAADSNYSNIVSATTTSGSASTFMRPTATRTFSGFNRVSSYAEDTTGYMLIDEAVADDSNFAEQIAGSGSTFRVDLGAGPGFTSGMTAVFRVRVAATTGSGALAGSQNGSILRFAKIQDGTTEIFNISADINCPAVWTTYEFNLSEAQTQTLANSVDVRMEFVMPNTGFSGGISWAEIELVG